MSDAHGNDPQRRAASVRSLWRAVRKFATTVAPPRVKRIVQIGLDRVVREQTQPVQTHVVALPPGYPAARVKVQLSTPPSKSRPDLEFCEHVMDGAGRATATVLASALRGFAISRDLGVSWKYVEIEGYEGHRVRGLKWIGDCEVLVQAVPPQEGSLPARAVAVLVVNEKGAVLAASQFPGSPWHGSRSVDMAHGTLMYAEYPRETADMTAEERPPSRVLRSRDRGRSWEIVRSTTHVRHFHFLQARPGVPGEWWLTSGDSPAESHIWVSRDDGDSWSNITGRFADTIEIGGIRYPRSLFRLTDLAWNGDEIVWGTDDDLRDMKGGVPGPRVFRSPCEPVLAPGPVGSATWPVRSMVDLGDFFIFLTQGGSRPNVRPQDKRPGVFLMPKTPVVSAPGLVHLFDVETHGTTRTGFTYSRASRAAKDGTFFTFRSTADAFAAGHKVLRWDVSFS